MSADGKSIKDAVQNYNSSSQNFVSIVSVFASTRGLILDIKKLDNKEEGEIQVVQNLITALDIECAVFSFDWLHCQKKLAS
ncbi:hypothetical protein [Nostoc sp.]|uniref:hypothetical protein n=1 Tax=Nostoc sp. TaxID=1180 RepID=UPI002FFA01C3